MKRYYFYAPSEERTKHKDIGLIRFRLKALYAEEAYDQRLGHRVTSFKYFDEIESLLIQDRKEFMILSLILV